MLPSKTPAALNRRALLQLGLAAAGAAALPGCDPRQAMYFLQPGESRVAAPCPSLKGKRVVILTSIAPTAAGEVGIDREITRGLADILRKNVKRIDVVDTSQVAAWVQAKPDWTDPAEAARAFDANIVIFLEIRQFQVDSASSPGLLQGQSSVAIRVIEWDHPKDDKGKPNTTREKESSVLYEGDRETVFPMSGGVPIEAGVGRSSFRNKFVKLVTTEISWTFIGRGSGEDIQDTRM
jgi:hypothetical protein